MIHFVRICLGKKKEKGFCYNVEKKTLTGFITYCKWPLFAIAAEITILHGSELNQKDS